MKKKRFIQIIVLSVAAILLLGIFIFVRPSGFAGLAGMLWATDHSDQATRVAIHEIDLPNQNLIITFPDEDQRWLLHYKKGCEGLTQDSKTVNLVAIGALDGVKDILKLSVDVQCDVDQAKEINDEFIVNSIFPAGTEAILTNEKGVRFSVQFPQTCGTIREFLNEKIYANLGDKSIQEGDHLYFPRNAGAGTCVVGFSRPVEAVKTVDKSQSFIQPGVISDLKAVPTDRAVELFWKKARADENVDYYWVSYDESAISTKGVSVADMPNRQKASANYFKVTGLYNNQPYFFTVIAIDKQGRAASQWSNVATTIPKASAFRPGAESGNVNRKLDLHVSSEDDRMIIFEWSLLTHATHYLVSLEKAGVREFTLDEKQRKLIRIGKTAARKGRNLRLNVKAMDGLKLLDEAYYSFKF
ncbi:fibronectin type III domain-containing protein [Candidatus Peregrinibacteria bacterium]|nr:fibronectin type III domain-containing protein [Candidatus Peregrinibacteria bacterium]